VGLTNPHIAYQFQPLGLIAAAALLDPWLAKMIHDPADPGLANMNHFDCYKLTRKSVLRKYKKMLKNRDLLIPYLILSFYCLLQCHVLLDLLLL